MIAERAQRLSALIDRRAVLRAHVNQLDAFQGRQEKLSTLVERFRPRVEAADVLRQRGISSISMKDRIPGLLEQLRRVQNVYREERDAFVDAQRSGFSDFERTCNACFTDLETQVQDAWRTYTSQRARPLDPEVLRVLAAVPAYADSIRRLRALDQTVTELRATLPTDAVCQRFESAAEERRTVWADMGGGDMSPEILRFLRGASSGGVPLDALTPTVRQWMEAHGLSDSFRITVAARGGE